MKKSRKSAGWFLVGALLFASIPSLRAQDPTKVDPAHYKTEFENNDVRVLRIKYGPGEESVMHEHPKGVAVYLDDAEAQFTLPNGEVVPASGKKGEVVWTDGGLHKPKNVGDKPFEVIQVELKGDSGMGNAPMDQEERYTTSSPAIDKVKELIQNYENQDWDSWKSHYADNAELYHNNWDQAATPEQFMQRQEKLLSNVSAYEFVNDPVFYEQIIDDDGHKWVYFWGIWQGTLKSNDQQLRIPVHLAFRFEDGKIVEEYGFYDLSEYMKMTGGQG